MDTYNDATGEELHVRRVRIQEILGGAEKCTKIEGFWFDFS